MKKDGLLLEKEHLVRLLEAIQRCVFFLDASTNKLTWPLSGAYLSKEKTNVEVFETLSSINERFSKLQDTLGAAMRHAAIFSGESANVFLKVLSFYEKIDVIESLESWQRCRATRNLAAHDYGVDYAEIAEHFNIVHELLPFLYATSRRFFDYCVNALNVQPRDCDFFHFFHKITDEYSKK